MVALLCVNVDHVHYQVMQKFRVFFVIIINIVKPIELLQQLYGRKRLS